MTNLKETYNSVYNQFERENILNSLSIDELNELAHSQAKDVKKRCERFLKKRSSILLLGYGDIRLFQKKFGIPDEAKEFDLKIDQYTFRIKFNEEFEVWRVLVNFSSGVSLSYSL